MQVYSFVFFLGKLYPFGQIPVLEVDGVVITESLAISRYVAAEFGNTSSTSA